MDLKELLGEELYNQVKEQLGEHEVAVISDGSYIPKDKFNDKINEIKEYKKQLQERDEQMEELSKKAEGHKTLKGQIDSLKQANQEATEKYEKQLREQQFNYELARHLVSHNSRNPKTVKALLDIEEMKITEDGNILGLEEQLNQLKESDSYLFSDSITENNTTDRNILELEKKINQIKETNSYLINYSNTEKNTTELSNPTYFKPGIGGQKTNKPAEKDARTAGAQRAMERYGLNKGDE